jgi:cholesterol 7-dehydrogenase
MVHAVEKFGGYPTGWFPVAFSAEVRPGKVFRSALAGEDVVAYRTKTGQLRIVRPYCPHLGAHLGHGGKVDGEHLVCPFHGFGFALDGTCDRTSYGSPPPRMELTQVPSGEANGLIFAWYSPSGDEPAWRFHSFPDDGFGEPVNWITTGPGHPIDFIENTVDFGHFATVHGTTIVATDTGEMPKPEFHDFHMMVTLPLSGFQFSNIRVTFTITCDGLGHAMGEAHIPQLRLRVRENLGWTPTAPGQIAFRKASFSRFDQPAQRWHPGRLAAMAVRPLVARVMSSAAAQQGNQDVIIWNNRRFIEHPRLSRGDGPIMEYRRWATRFFDGEQLAALAGSNGRTTALSTPVTAP